MTARSTSGLGLPDDAGLQLEAVYGRFDGEPFGDGARNTYSSAALNPGGSRGLLE
jgi:hypothetical protein